jgi:hypothetical protein
VSDTPRTDGEIDKAGDFFEYESVVSARFARQLERELSQCRAALKAAAPHLPSCTTALRLVREALNAE